MWHSFRKAVWGLVLPIIILGGIYTGVFTPTEAAGVAIVYSLLIGVFIYKELNLKNLFQITKKSVITSAMIMLIIASANIFSWYLTYQQIPAKLASVILEFADTQVMFLLIVTVILLIAGMFIDASAAVLIFTPPFGLNLYVAAGISKMPIMEIIKGALPFIIILIMALFVIMFVPQLSLFLVK